MHKLVNDRTAEQTADYPVADINHDQAVLDGTTLSCHFKQGMTTKQQL